MDNQKLHNEMKNLCLHKSNQNLKIFYSRTFSNRSTESPQKEKPVKTRRKPRPKKEKKPKTKSELEISFNIKPIENQIKSKFIKYRNDKHKYVNLHSFLNDIRKIVIFKNSTCDNTFINDLDLSVATKATENGICKIKKKKYNTSDLQYQNSSLKTLGSKNSRQEKRRKKCFEPYINENELEEKLKSGNLIQGILRINSKNYKEAYVSNVDENENDYLISSIRDRNRALEGDVVYLKLKPKEEWKDHLFTADVVYIKEKVHNRTAIGYLTMGKDSKQNAILIPRDIRLPRMHIPKTNWPPRFKENFKSYEKILFVAKIIDWTDPKYAVGNIIEQLGIDNELKVQNKALILENLIDIAEIPEVALADIQADETVISNEMESREDLRKECIFTIDPITAKDLDDAMSLKKLRNGNYEIGVHIADPTYYIPDESCLDKIIMKKATSTYLVDKVYHMLPTDLCLHCSLLPLKDSLAFSVIWEMDPNANVINHRFAKTVIRSCGQLAYEHAQLMIENPDKKFTDDELPPITNGYDSNYICDIVQILQKLAVKLRTRRFINGALRIDQPKLQFELDITTRTPISMSIHESKDAHKLIEEFMLLANCTVAEKIQCDYPDIAFLRNHKPPYTRILKDVRKQFENLDISLEIETAADIQASLWKIDTTTIEGHARLAVINHLITKAMKRANYICAGSADRDYHHYSLSVPCYTHFTSPIRRYADMMVHRLLNASIGCREKPKWTENFVRSVANNCNTQKSLAKKASDASTELYLAYFVEKNQPFIKKAVVTVVKDRYFEIIVLDTGSCLKIQTNALGDNILHDVIETEETNHKILITFTASDNQPELKQVIDVFQVIDVSLTRRPKTNRLNAELVRPQ